MCLEGDVHQMDIVTAYIQSNLSNEIYMEQLKAFEVQEQEEKVCLVKRPLYGLKQADRCCYEKLDTYLKNINIINNDVNSCVYISNNKNDRIIVIIYVNNLLIASQSLRELQKLKEASSKNFQINDLRPVHDILGINIERDEPTGKMRLTQQKYITDLLQKFGIKNCKPILSSLESNQKLIRNMDSNIEKERINMKHKPYRKIVGSLIYLANAIHPDLAFAAGALSRFCTDPEETH